MPASKVWWTVADESGAVVASGVAEVSEARDRTVSVDVGGLAGGTRYRYWFDVLGERSPVGRTKTLPQGECAALRFAQVSCAKFNAGYFNAYGRIAARDDLDFVLHLGDYIYEASQTPPASQTASKDIGRPFSPLHECKTLEDYRRRYAQYRSDPDVQAMHAAQPLIATVDDHEFADGAWREGATEHRDERDGPWAQRVARAFQAREEWLPIRRPAPEDPTRVYRRVRLGDLGDLHLIDTRTRRDQPCPSPGMDAAGRTALGLEQRRWLERSLVESPGVWRLIGNPSVFAHTWTDTLSPRLRSALTKLKLLDLDGHGCDWDQWDGYPGEREEILSFIADKRLPNVVFLSGDVHVGMAIELARQAGVAPVAVEFVNTSVTSQNLDDKMGWPPLTESLPLAEEFVTTLEHMKWADFDSHGYSIVEVTPRRVRMDWWGVDVSTRSDEELHLSAWAVDAGSSTVYAVSD